MTQPEFNMPAEVVQKYEPFPGPLTEAMRQLRDTKNPTRIPMNVRDIRERQVTVDGNPDANRKVWQERWFWTPDAIAYQTNGDFQFVREAQPIFSLTPKSTLRNGALVITDDIYAAQDGLELTSADRKYFDNQMTEEQALRGDDPQATALRYLFRADKEPTRAENAISGIFRIGKDRYRFDEMSGIYLAGTPQASAGMRAVVADRVDYRAGLDGDVRLGNINGLLAGVVAPEAPAPRGISLDDALEQVYGPLASLIGGDLQPRVRAELCEALGPVLAARDTAYRDRVHDATRTVVQDYLGPKPLGELEERLATLNAE